MRPVERRPLVLADILANILSGILASVLTGIVTLVSHRGGTVMVVPIGLGQGQAWNRDGRDSAGIQQQLLHGLSLLIWSGADLAPMSKL